MKVLAILTHVVYQFMDTYMGKGKQDEIDRLVSGDMSNVDFRIGKFWHKMEKVIGISNSR